MNPYKAEWIAALRSGKYSQTSGTLRDEAGFCCLGVACDLYDPNGWDAETFKFTHTNRSMVSHVPEVVAEKLGISLELQRTLVTLNDGRELTFEQIADYLEENDNDNS